MSAVGQQPTAEVIVQQPSSFQSKKLKKEVVFQQPGSFQPNQPAQSGMFNNVVVEPVVAQTQPTNAQEECKSIASDGWNYSNKWETDLFDCTEYG